jgi:predicted metal-dependent hydrolase
MIDWLKRPPREEPAIVVGTRRLPVVIRRLAHARRLTLRLAPDGSEVRLSMPRWGRTAEALAFVHARADWLERQLAALPPAAPPRPGGHLAYRGGLLAIAHDPAGRRQPELRDGAIHAGGPETALAGRLRRWLEREARTLSAQDLAHYCARAARPVPPLALSGARRRWGSCGPDGTIRINWRLVMAPDFVRRSVVAHEVAHLVHFDHSPRFHALLGELFDGDLAAANAWLRDEGRTLYAPFG